MKSSSVPVVTRLSAGGRAVGMKVSYRGVKMTLPLPAAREVARALEQELMDMELPTYAGKVNREDAWLWGGKLYTTSEVWARLREHAGRVRKRGRHHQTGGAR